MGWMSYQSVTPTLANANAKPTLLDRIAIHAGTATGTSAAGRGARIATATRRARTTPPVTSSQDSASADLVWLAPSAISVRRTTTGSHRRVAPSVLVTLPGRPAISATWRLGNVPAETRWRAASVIDARRTRRPDRRTALKEWRRFASPATTATTWCKMRLTTSETA